MIAVDTNVLVHAHRRDSPHHDSAAAVMRDLAESPQPWCLPWPCVHEFLAVVTRARYFSVPSTIDQAVTQVDAWMSSPSCLVLGESAHHWVTLRTLLDQVVGGGSVHDAKIAAICLDQGVSELLTQDSGFVSGGLRVRDPFR